MGEKIIGDQMSETMSMIVGCIGIGVICVLCHIIAHWITDILQK